MGCIAWSKRHQQAVGDGAYTVYGNDQWFQGRGQKLRENNQQIRNDPERLEGRSAATWCSGARFGFSTGLNTAAHIDVIAFEVRLL